MVLAIDFGASKIRIAETSGIDINRKQVFKTPKNKKEILSLLYKLIAEYPRQNLGIGVAGFVKKGIVEKSPNMDFNNVKLKSILERKFGILVTVDNDANCAGIAEARYGLANGRKTAVILTIGTGIGGAIIIDGRLYQGNGFAGEPGHMLIDGKKFENIASGRAFHELARKRGFGEEHANDLETLARNGNKKAKMIFEEIGTNLGKGIFNIVTLLDPEVVILSGGLSEVKAYMPSLIKEFKRNDFTKRKIDIVQASLKGDAGLIGAGLLA
jgi:predicted NBD/HSP70 family sugar kinase